MLISAKFKDDKIIAIHGQDVSGELEYASEMRKDPNNGWTKERTMRKVATIPQSAIKRYEETHPGFEALAFGRVTDWKLRDTAIRDFLKWKETAPFTWGKV